MCLDLVGCAARPKQIESENKVASLTHPVAVQVLAQAQLVQTVIELRNTASMGILWEQLPEEGRELLRRQMRKQNITAPGYLGGL